MEDTTSLGDTASTTEVATAAYAELSGETPAPVETTTETTPPSADAAPIVPQAVTSTSEPPATDPAAAKPKPGPVEYARFHEVNERMKTAEATAQTTRQQLEQLESHPIFKQFQRYGGDPIEFAIGLLNEIQGVPELDQRLRSQAARWMRAGQAQPTAVADEAMPEPDLRDANGSYTVYSGERMKELLQWQQKQLLGHVEKTIAPITAKHKQSEEIAQATAAMQRVTSEATTILTEWRAAPGWTKENEPQIKKRYAELVKQGQKPELAIGLAYRDVVVPTLAQRERQAVTASLQTKTQATTMSPQRGVTTPAKAAATRDTRDLVREALAEMRA